MPLMNPQPVLYFTGMKVVSAQKRGNQAEIITPTHPDMTLDVARTKNPNKQTSTAYFRENADILPQA